MELMKELNWVVLRFKRKICKHEWRYVDEMERWKGQDTSRVTALAPSYDLCLKCGERHFLGLLEESRTGRRAL